MCDIIDRERAEGKAEGKAEGLAENIALIRKKYEKKITPEQAAEALEMDVSYVKMVMNMLSETPQQLDKEIAMRLIQR